MNLKEHLPWVDKRPREALEVIVCDQQALYVFDQSKYANEAEVFSSMLRMWGNFEGAERILPIITSATVENLKYKGLIEQASITPHSEYLPYMQITQRGKDAMKQVLQNRRSFREPVKVHALVTPKSS